MTLSPAELDKLQLIRTTGVGPVAFRQLLARFGDAATALRAVPDLARRGGGTPRKVASREHVEQEANTVARLGARYLFVGDASYPPLLAELDTAPAALTVRGTLDLFEQPAVAIVGARNASAAACRFARGLAYDLAEQGVLVVSGLARGIDTAAHQGATRSTAAVIASGIDKAYPPENAELQEQVATAGILIAEQPPGVEPLARHFPYRNRIIAGLSLGTVVVEAAPKSGSLITARLAGEAGRDVMAVPGSPLDPRAQGCNQLIREGATLVQNAADVLETVQPLGGGVRAVRDGFVPAPPQAEPDDRERAAVRELLGHTPVPVDELVRLANLHPAVVSAVLLELELGGHLTRHAGGRVSA